MRERESASLYHILQSNLPNIVLYWFCSRLDFRAGLVVHDPPIDIGDGNPIRPVIYTLLREVDTPGRYFAISAKETRPAGTRH